PSSVLATGKTNGSILLTGGSLESYTSASTPPAVSQKKLLFLRSSGEHNPSFGEGHRQGARPSAGRETLPKPRRASHHGRGAGWDPRSRAVSGFRCTPPLSKRRGRTS